MQTKSFEFSAKNVADATSEGLKSLGITEDQAIVEVLENGGFLKKAKVKITKKATEGDVVIAFCETVLEKMGITAVVEMTETEEAVMVNIIATESGTIIGHRGDVLDAIQYIASILANQDKPTFKRVVVDCENYREKRMKTLEELAVKMSEKALRLKKKIHLEPMNPFERRIIHATLTKDERVKTASEGEEPLRHLVIMPADFRDFGGKRRNGNFNRDGKGGNRNGSNRNGGFKRDGGNRNGGFKRDGENRNGGGFERRDNRDGGRDGGFRRDRKPFENRTNTEERAPRPKTDFSSFAYLGKSEEKNED